MAGNLGSKLMDVFLPAGLSFAAVAVTANTGILPQELYVTVVNTANNALKSLAIDPVEVLNHYEKYMAEQYHGQKNRYM
ncbi:MAG: hypothetical protein AABW92_03445 [Nanoarchaeota archaeon]